MANASPDSFEDDDLDELIINFITDEDITTTFEGVQPMIRVLSEVEEKEITKNQDLLDLPKITLCKTTCWIHTKKFGGELFYCV